MIVDATAAEGMSAERFARSFDALVANVGRAIKGKDDVIRLAVVALLAEGHMLFEDVPGTGKTVLAQAIGHSIGANVGRVSCTPDLLPSDLTGSPVLDRRTGELVFRPGPVFANVLLCDELNRATPKTQSALLEAMQERAVTVDGVSYALPEPFLVFATQNPIELAGTFPLPEAQLDRFLFRLTIGYPDRDAEAEVLRANTRRGPVDALRPVGDVRSTLALIEWAAGVTVAESIELYIVDLVGATRRDVAVQLPASPRAALALHRAARVVAAADGRDDVIPDDVRTVVEPVFGHRILLTPEAELRGERVDDAIARVLAQVPVPMGLAPSSPSRRRGPQ